MQPQRIQRVIRQNLQTDYLLGATAVRMPTRFEKPVAQAKPQDVAPSNFHSGKASASPVRSVGTPEASPVTAAQTPSCLWQPPVDLPKGLSVTEKEHTLEQLDQNHVRVCHDCDLCQTRTQTVFGEGMPDADLMFIGEGPGQQEDLQGRPFVGPAGQLLDKMIVAMGLSRQSVYIANVVKCRPPGNRAPREKEAQACSHYLLHQIAIVEPKVIVTLGGAATKLLLQTNRGITGLRGTWFRFEGLGAGQPVIDLMPTFHPAYLLRSYTTENRRKVWSDLQKVLERLHV